ncbi:MAG: hypothetical protein M3Q88_05325, partial [Pseudomonadota bacterium]|nr:hypothetical protein [Pseudomonadota bacterium]
MTKRNRVKAMFCSKLAIATALVAGGAPVAAQSFQGTIDSSTGIGAVTNAGGNTNITVNGQQAVINWTATGTSNGTLTTFQDSGVATFQGATDFAVLNRVSANIAGNGIYMNGAVNSLVGDITGGTVYFYSPNGIVIGNNASFNVGSLGLTTLPIADDGQGNWMTGFGTGSPQVVFGQATNPNGFVRTDSGAQLNASGFGSYVALVAPRVEHRGIIRTDGGAALVGAAGATVTFNTSGMFDIQVTTGSSDANGVVVDGGTIARNSQEIGSSHNAYLVAVPANNAMTMLVQGGAQLGFDIAGSAAVEGNAVILSAGGNVFGGQTVAPPSRPVNVNVNNASITSNFAASAGGAIDIGSSSGTTSFSGSVNAMAGTRIDINATTKDIMIGGTLDASVDRFGDVAKGGDIRIGARDGATLSVAGDTTLRATGFGFSAADDGASAGNGTGGSILVQAGDGGTVRLVGGLVARADGVGGVNSYSNGAGGTGTGGLVQVLANGGNASVSVGGISDLSANGIGGSTGKCSVCAIIGGNGSGGQIDVNGATGAGNRLAFNGGLRMNANGVGGAGDAGAGSGTGGEAILGSGDGTVVSVAKGLVISVYGSGGYNSNGAGGSGIGGVAGIRSFGGNGGTITVAGDDIDDILLAADGFGGGSGGAGAGGVGRGGFVYVDAPGAATTINGNLMVTAEGYGGSSSADSGGNGTGGVANIKAAGANLTINGTLRALLAGHGGGGLLGGSGQGGQIYLHAENGATLRVAGNVSVEANADGGLGGFNVGGSGGGATGGNVSVWAANGGSLSLKSLFADAGADGASGSTGGKATGGTADVSTFNGSSIAVDLYADIAADAYGGGSFDTSGSTATGGRINWLAVGGGVTVGTNLNLSAGGWGGDTLGIAASGGNGQGGSIAVGADDGGTLTLVGVLIAEADGFGGGMEQETSSAGSGTGGTIALRATGSGSTVDARSTVDLIAEGEGGSSVGECAICGGAGGNGIGGRVTVQTSGGLGNAIRIAGNTMLNADGLGSDGFGGTGGNGIGGDTIITLNDDGQIAFGGNLNLTAEGDGGYHSNGGTAGNGAGGDAAIHLMGTAGSRLSVAGATEVETGGYGGSTGIAARGIGGNGAGGGSRIFGTGGEATFTGAVVVTAIGEGGSAGIGGGTGGNGSGGLTRVESDGAAFTFAGDLALEARSIGGNGRIGGNAIAFVGDNPPVTPTTDARILARNATIRVAGLTVLDVSATGGTGSDGGAGGNATAGYATVHARNSDLGPATIALGDLEITAAAQGGDGGTGSVGNFNGGAGGSATGGFIAPTAAAGNGHLIIATTLIDG